MDTVQIRIRLRSTFLQVLPLADVADLHNVYLALEELQETVIPLTAAGEQLRLELLTRVTDLQRALREELTRAPAIVSDLKNLVHKLYSGHRKEQVDACQTRGTLAATLLSPLSLMPLEGRVEGRKVDDQDCQLSDVPLHGACTESVVTANMDDGGRKKEDGRRYNRQTNGQEGSTLTGSHINSGHVSKSVSKEGFGKEKEFARVTETQSLPFLSRQRYMESVGQMCSLLEALLGPKEEQDMVGFGVGEILGVKLSGGSSLKSDNVHGSHSVYYFTNRRQIGRTEERGEFYGMDFTEEISCGVTEVSCPDGKPQVKHESQFAGAMDMENFKESLRSQIEKDDKKSVILYVHGCFTDFGRAMGYGAQIARGLDFKGPMCVYSWPTVGRPSLRVGLGVIDLYRKDEENSQQSGPQLRDVLQMLSKEVGAKNIHIVAYSMGARTLLEALRLLGPEDLSPETGVTSHMYFMAPDATANFFSQVAREFKFPKAKVRREAVGGIEGEERVKTGVMGENGACFVDEDVIAEPRELMDFSEGCTMNGEGSASLKGETVFTVLEQLADLSSNIVGDTVSAIRTAGQVWREGRKQGWVEALKAVFGPDTAEEKMDVSDSRPNSHIHLYAAQNDVALVLSELLDRGTPQIRAGRRTKEFLLCNNTFDTIDASALKQGLLTSGHFYLFHKIVSADIRHLLDGRTDLPWWRQMAEWRHFQYFKLRHMKGGSVSLSSSVAQDAIAETQREVSLTPQVTTSPLFWASP